MNRLAKLAGAAALTFCTAACSKDVDQPQAEEGAPTIECSLGEGSDFGPDCMVEREEIDGQTVLTVRHPDGGFRRFVQLNDGQGLAELDGADEVNRSLDGSTLVIEVGQDSYRFDANVRDAEEGAEEGANEGADEGAE